MKLVRFINLKDNKIYYGDIKKNYILSFADNPFKDNFNISNNIKVKLENCKLLSPCNPSKIIGIAINYSGSSGITKEMKEPLFFLKSSNAISLNNETVKIYNNFDTWGESELAFVVKKKTNKTINNKNVKNYILGYLPATDITSSNIDNRDHHLARSKSLDGYCTIGEYIDTDYNFKNKLIKGYQNNILIRSSNTNKLFWSPHDILKKLSKFFTFYPGDIVLTGAPPRVVDKKFLKKGDVYTVSISGFHKLNTFF